MTDLAVLTASSVFLLWALENLSRLIVWSHITHFISCRAAGLQDTHWIALTWTLGFRWWALLDSWYFCFAVSENRLGNKFFSHPAHLILQSTVSTPALPLVADASHLVLKSAMMLGISTEDRLMSQKMVGIFNETRIVESLEGPGCLYCQNFKWRIRRSRATSLAEWTTWEVLELVSDALRSKKDVVSANIVRAL